MRLSRHVFSLLSLTAVSACSPKDYCIVVESPQHRASLVREFSADGIAVKPDTNDGLCVSGSFSLEADRVRARVESYRYDVAVMVKTAEERKRLVALLQREGKEFKIGAPSDRGELVIVLSGSAEEAVANLALVEAWE